MKNIFLKASLFYLILFTFSCSSETDYIEPTGLYFVKTKIDGVSTNFEDFTILVTNARQTAVITATNSNYKLVINLSNYTKVGEYDLATAQNSAILIDNQTPANTFSAYEGKLIITKVTDRGAKLGTALDGTFNFKAEDQNGTEKELTEGSLSLKVTEL